MKDAPIEIEGKVDKRQEIARPIGKGLVATAMAKPSVAQSDADGSFSYTLDAKNESNTWVDEFTITDDLECAKEGTAKLIAIETPVATGHRRSLQRVVSNVSSGKYRYGRTDQCNAQRRA